MAYQKMLGAAESTSISDVVDSPAFKTASTVASVYHGYRRNDSILWAIVWGLASRVAPVVTPTVAAAQGFGKKK